jgi:hypothetical protein
VAKHRNGETGMVTLGFEGALTRFNNLVRDQDANPNWGLPENPPVSGSHGREPRDLFED